MGVYNGDRMKRYIWNILIWIDQGFNTIPGPLLNIFIRSAHKFGNPDETLSSVFGKNVREGKCFGTNSTRRGSLKYHK